MSVISQLLTLAAWLLLEGFLAKFETHRNNAVNCGCCFLVYLMVMQGWVSRWKWKVPLKVNVYS